MKSFSISKPPPPPPDATCPWFDSDEEALEWLAAFEGDLSALHIGRGGAMTSRALRALARRFKKVAHIVDQHNTYGSVRVTREIIEDS